MEGEYDRIEHVSNQEQINALHHEADSITLINRGVDERVIDLPTKFSLWDASTNELLINSSSYSAIRGKTGADATTFTRPNIHDAIAESGEYLFRMVSATQAAFSVKYEVDKSPITNATQRIERIRKQAKQYNKTSGIGRWA